MPIQLTVMSLDFDSKTTPYTKVYDKDEITIGRLPNNDLVLDRPEVSAYHAKIRLTVEDDGKELSLHVKDLGSSNGTMVENKSLRAQVEIDVGQNQRIIIGNYLIKPQAIAPEVKATPAKTNVTNMFDHSAEDDTDAEESSLFAEAESRQVVGGWPYQTFSTSADTDLLRRQDDEDLDDEMMEDDGEDTTGTAEMPAAESESPATTGTGFAGTSLETTHLETRDFLASSDLFEVPASDTKITQSKPLPEEIAAERPEFKISMLQPSAPASAPAKFASTIEIHVDTDHVQNIDFNAAELFALSGKIVHRGLPMQGVTVSAGTIGSCTTDFQGKYQFTDIAEGTPVELTVERSGFLFEGGQTSMTIRGDAAVEFTAVQLFSVSGIVRHRGQPLAGVAVDGAGLGRRTTGADGTFTFGDVREGTNYTLHLRKERFSFDRGSVSGTVQDSETHCEITATQLFSVSGKISHNGKPLAGVVVDGGPALGKTVTDSEGRYLFESVPENTKYTLTAQKEKFSFAPLKQ